MQCEKCGGEIAEGGRFCAACGAPAPNLMASVEGAAQAGGPASTAQRATKHCQFCGEEILETAVKCRYCGSQLVASATQANPTAGITLNAPGATPGQGMPSIVIQNVQAQQPPVQRFVPGNYKNPGLALFLSFIFPGGGQFYNGHVGKGFIVLLTCWLVIPYIWSLFDAYSSAQRINRVGF